MDQHLCLPRPIEDLISSAATVFFRSSLKLQRHAQRINDMQDIIAIFQKVKDNVGEIS